MRVLIVHPCTIAYAAFHNVNLLIAALKARGDDVAVLAPGTEQDRLPYSTTPSFTYIPISFDGAWVARSVKRRVNAFDPDIIHVWNPRTLTSRVALELMVGTGARLVVNYEDPEHFHFDTVTGPVKSASVLRHVDKPYLTSHDVEAFVSELNWHWILQHIRNPDSSQFLHPLFFALLNHLASGFTGIWHPWVALLKPRFQKPVALMPYGVDFSALRSDPAAAVRTRQELNIPADTTVFLRAGTLYPMMRDVDNMLAGFAEHLRGHPNSRLVLCGRDHTADQTTESIRRLGIAASTLRFGYLPEDKLDALIETADVVISPGYPDEYNRYRLAVKNITYMASGKALICYGSGLGESLTDGREALILSDYTPAAVAACMTRLATDMALRVSLGREARAFARTWFDVDAIAARIHDFYAGLLAPSTPVTGVVAPGAVMDWNQAVRAHRIWQDKLAPLAAAQTPVYIYGAGKHTESLQQFGWLDRLNTQAVLDDASPKTSIGRHPGLRPGSISFDGTEVLLLSSDSAEPQLHAKAIAFFPCVDRIVCLYGGQPTGPTA